jgi:hypothetical protein
VPAHCPVTAHRDSGGFHWLADRPKRIRTCGAQPARKQGCRLAAIGLLKSRSSSISNCFAELAILFTPAVLQQPQWLSFASSPSRSKPPAPRLRLGSLRTKSVL